MRFGIKSPLQEEKMKRASHYPGPGIRDALFKELMAPR
jgi:hypothetical protein